MTETDGPLCCQTNNVLKFEHSDFEYCFGFRYSDFHNDYFVSVGS